MCQRGLWPEVSISNGYCARPWDNVVSDAAMSDHIIYEVADGVGQLTINRPEKRNAMTFAMLGEFTREHLSGCSIRIQRETNDSCRFLLAPGHFVVGLVLSIVSRPKRPWNSQS